jgi:GNAT superfamily N-acetyltransferase
MYTEERARGQGAGRAILEGLVDWFRSRGIPHIELSATPEAEPLYRRYGFVDKPWGRPLQLRVEGLPGTRPDRC